MSMAYTNALKQGELVCWRARNPKRLRKEGEGRVVGVRAQGERYRVDMNFESC